MQLFQKFDLANLSHDNPTKRQKELIKIFEEEVAPWCYVDKKTGDIKLKEDAPKNIKDKYYLYMNS